MNKDKISELAQSLFFERGIKAVNMDDIAFALGISKKTIYNFFSSKDEIVAYEIDKHIVNHKIEFEKIFLNSQNAIDELRLIYQMNMRQHRIMKPVFVSDIQKLYQSCWKKLEQFLHEFISKNIASNIQRGHNEGLYKTELNIEFLSHQYYGGILNMIDYFSHQQKYSISDLQKEHIYYHIHGIGTAKGIKYLDKINFEE